MVFSWSIGFRTATRLHERCAEDIIPRNSRKQKIRHRLLQSILRSLSPAVVDGASQEVRAKRFPGVLRVECLSQHSRRSILSTSNDSRASCSHPRRYPRLRTEPSPDPYISGTVPRAAFAGVDGFTLQRGEDLNEPLPEDSDCKITCSWTRRADGRRHSMDFMCDSL